MKKCITCKIEKDLSKFSKNKRAKDGLNYTCKSCKNEKLKKWREANIEHEKQYYQNNKERIKEYRKQYRKANKELIKERNKKYYQANKDKRNEYRRQRRQSDPMYKLKCNLRKRAYSALKNKGYSKDSKTQEMLGVDWEVCKAHIERQFTKGMNWTNYGKWHVDHIIPLASAKTPERLKQLCHYSNLQPMWAEDNLSKSDSINGQQNKLRI